MSVLFSRRSPTPSTASNTHVDDVSSSEPPTPTASPRKEPGSGGGGSGGGASNVGGAGTTSSGSGGTSGGTGAVAPTPTNATGGGGSGSGSNRGLTKKQQRELAPCKLLLEQLEQQDESWPFLLPVNTKQFPTYKKIIKTPMDLSTIKKKLQDTV